MDKPKTQDLLSFLAATEAKGKILILTDGAKINVHLSARNVADISVLPFGNESVYDVLWAHTIVIERSALESQATEAEAEPEEVESDA
jgi:ribosomal protein L4